MGNAHPGRQSASPGCRHHRRAGHTGPVTRSTQPRNASTSTTSATTATSTCDACSRRYLALIRYRVSRWIMKSDPRTAADPHRGCPFCVSRDHRNSWGQKRGRTARRRRKFVMLHRTEMGERDDPGMRAWATRCGATAASRAVSTVPTPGGARAAWPLVRDLRAGRCPRCAARRAVALLSANQARRGRVAAHSSHLRPT
jgi:hypothetical protein